MVLAEAEIYLAHSHFPASSVKDLEVGRGWGWADLHQEEALGRCSEGKQGPSGWYILSAVFILGVSRHDGSMLRALRRAAASCSLAFSTLFEH